MLSFDMPKDQSSIIKVLGVGGGGGNAVNHMYNQGIVGVDFIICNTDAQALELSPIPNKIQLGSSLTEGMGAGSIPEVGKNSAIETIEQLKEFLEPHTRMLFITAGMGGGTGTGASPVIAQAAKELGILTVAIVTTPFSFEGKRRRQQAEEGLAELKKHVDTLLVVSNDKMREMYGNLTLANAFAQADNILTTAAKGIAEIITVPGYINVDFKDVRTVMSESGVAIMGSHAAEGDDRALKAVQGALASPLLNDNEIEGARYILLNITSGAQEVLMDEVSVITDYIQEEAGLSADIIWGNCYDETLGDKLSVTLIATGFQTKSERYGQPVSTGRKVSILTDEKLANTVKLPELEISSTEGSNEPMLKPIETPKHIKQVSMFDEVFPKSENKPIPKPSPIPTTKKIILEEPQAPAEVPVMMQDMSVEENEGDESIEQQLRRSKERIMRLKDLSMKLRTPTGVSDLETEPAYVRRKVMLDQNGHSSESQLSKYALGTDENGLPEIRPNGNPFLDPNVD